MRQGAYAEKRTAPIAQALALSSPIWRRGRRQLRSPCTCQSWAHSEAQQARAVAYGEALCWGEADAVPPQSAETIRLQFRARTEQVDRDEDGWLTKHCDELICGCHAVDDYCGRMQRPADGSWFAPRNACSGPTGRARGRTDGRVSPYGQLPQSLQAHSPTAKVVTRGGRMRCSPRAVLR